VPHLALDPENREGWVPTVLGVLLPVLRPQELLFPDGTSA